VEVWVGRLRRGEPVLANLCREFDGDGLGGELGRCGCPKFGGKGVVIA
jgi:hypothetical protein